MEIICNKSLIVISNCTKGNTNGLTKQYRKPKSRKKMRYIPFQKYYHEKTRNIERQPT